MAATTNNDAAAMLAKSDSEDSDFDPKAVAPSEMDSVAAEAFHEQDAVPEHECSDVERPGFDEDDNNNGEQATKKQHAGNAYSANGIAKENDGDDAENDSKVENGEPKKDANRDGSNTGNGITKEEESVAVEKDSPEEKEVDRTTKDGSKVEVETADEKNPVEKVVTAVAVKEDKEANGDASVEAKPASSEVKEAPVPVSAEDDATKGLSAVAKAAVAALESKKEASDTKNNESLDELWKSMNQPVAKPASARKRPASSSASSGLDAWLSGETSAPAKVSSGLPRLEEATEASEKLSAKLNEEEAAKRQQEAEEEGRAKKRQKVGTGLESVLAAAKGEAAGPTTMDRAKKEWKEFKKGDEEIQDELEAYKKDKSRYTERVGFLERSNVREWEVEQAGKKGRPPPNSSRKA